MRFVIAVFLLAVAFAADPKPPNWPARYTATGTFVLPNAVPHAISEPVLLSYDATGGKVAMAFYGETNINVIRYDTNEMWSINPRVDKRVCNYMTGVGAKPAQMTTLLPDLSTWKFAGKTVINKRNVDKFSTTMSSPAPSNYNSSYDFFVDSDSGHPVELQMKGYNIIWGAHPDMYSFSFHSYRPNVLATHLFDRPADCKADESVARSLLRARTQFGLVHALHPVHSKDEFDHYAVAHNKLYTSEKEKIYRKKVYLHNRALIDAHNANPNSSNKLAINHFADMTPEERLALYSANHHQKRTLEDGATLTHVVDAAFAAPPSIDWREKGAVTQVKDQGVCGSCWTFGSAASLEGVHKVKTGKLVELSEQQIMDCAYIGQDSGCDGGFAYNAYAWLMKTKGLAEERSYPYRMQDNYCHDVHSGVRIKGFANVTSGDETALMNAVATVGPVTCAINTLDPRWYFHTGPGVYDEPLSSCPNGIDDLDHQITVVGYGNYQGTDYWLVKNSYSSFWGDKGYIKMARNKGNLCGIATQCNYPILE